LALLSILVLYSIGYSPGQLQLVEERKNLAKEAGRNSHWNLRAGVERAIGLSLYAPLLLPELLKPDLGRCAISRLLIYRTDQAA